ncbi:glycosyltransferase [Thermosulfurimonas sp. F29]|uniref:glycosyltransferase n=1 Tax=Thermosulfurimonas sp. F29 TaxID=2867247 RepID=UPI001C83757D|nr:glycosyltransferase [Thermosulfurimonas sp. F29]MBX6424287.1 glycosyltransferase [Thermosulfurimonas sp. F29]
MSKVAALVVTYNRLPLLRETIEALKNQTYPPEEILIVDNFSGDGTREWLTGEAKRYGLKTLFLPENTGGAGGFFHGLKWLSLNWQGDFIWLLDDDACPEAEALHKLLGAARQLPKALGFFPGVYTRQGQIEGYSWPKKHYRPGDFPPHPGYSLKETGEEPLGPVAVGTFVGLLLKFSAFKNIGFPRADFFICFDDIEYTWRLSRHGELYFVPSARIHHHYFRPVLRGPKVYYFFRNWTYLSVHIGARSRTRAFIFWWLYLLRHRNFSVKEWKLGLKGIRDGISGRLGKRL